VSVKSAAIGIVENDAASKWLRALVLYARPHRREAPTIRDEINKATKAARTAIRTDTATRHGPYAPRYGSIILKTSSNCTLLPARTLVQISNNQT
jgi:hypothetical protein